VKFEQWFEENYDDLVHLLKTDQEELLFKAWLAGYEAGMDYMGSWVNNPDRMGGQFTDEEIHRAERGGEGW